MIFFRRSDWIGSQKNARLSSGKVTSILQKAATTQYFFFSQQPLSKYIHPQTVAIRKTAVKAVYSYENACRGD